MKNLLVPIIVSALLLTACSTDTEPNATSAPSVSQNTLNIPVQPEKKTDLYGKILSMEGNEITVLQSDTSKDPTFNMLPDEKKKYMAALDESARTALKAEINAATLGEVRITVPVGIGMVKKTAQWPTAPNAEASLADLKPGMYVSVWLNAQAGTGKVAEFVKIAFPQ